jgi:hypothetical protein
VAGLVFFSIFSFSARIYIATAFAVVPVSGVAAVLVDWTTVKGRGGIPSSAHFFDDVFSDLER